MRVCDQDTNNLIAATIYEHDDDHVDAASTLSNPLTTDNAGAIEFFLTDMTKVTLRASKDGKQTQVVTEGVWRVPDPSDLATHLADTSDAHDASAISLLDTANQYTATNVETALAEVLDEVQAHEADTSAAHAASAISYNGGTGMSATDVEAAIDELATEKADDSGVVHNTLFDAHTVLAATSDNTPAAVTVAEQRILGRKTGGNITALTASEVMNTVFGLDLMDWQFVRKASDESVTSSTTLQDDDALLFAVGANQTWLYTIVVYWGSGGGQIKCRTTAPASSAGWYGTTRSAVATTASSHANGTAISFAGTTISGEGTCLVLEGIVRTAGTAGNLTFQWAQDSSNVAATTVGTDSYLIARRVA